MKFNMLAITALLATSSFAGEEKKTPIEIGNVSWGRDHDEAFKQSAISGKPVAILFQEVPGCAGCKEFGADVLTHPLMVEALEDEFIPLLIINNQPGNDRELLKKYREKQWNFQVLRFFDKDGRELIERRERIWDIHSVAGRLCSALRAGEREAPAYLANLSSEYNAKALKTAEFVMACFWVGERKLGSIDGVIKTEVGFMGRHEVVRVWYNPNQVGLREIVVAGKGIECASSILVDEADANSIKDLQTTSFQVRPKGDLTYRAAKPSDQKKQLNQSAYMKAGLTQMQLTKVNAYARHDRGKAHKYLSPRQLGMLMKLEAQTQADKP